MAVEWQSVRVRPLPGADGLQALVATLRSESIPDEWLGVIARENGFADADAIRRLTPGTELRVPTADSLRLSARDWQTMRGGVPANLQNLTQGLVIPPATAGVSTLRADASSVEAADADATALVRARSQPLREGVATLISELRGSWGMADGAKVEAAIARLVGEGYTDAEVRAEYARQVDQLWFIHPVLPFLVPQRFRNARLKPRERLLENNLAAFVANPHHAAVSRLLIPPVDVRDNVTRIVDEIHGAPLGAGRERRVSRRDPGAVNAILTGLIERGHSIDAINAEYANQIRQMSRFVRNLRNNVAFDRNQLRNDLRRFPESPQRTELFRLIGAEELPWHRRIMPRRP